MIRDMKKGLGIVNMQTSNIMIFTGMALKQKKQVNAPVVQKFIFDQDEVAKAIPIEDIEMALDLLRYAGFIEPVGEKGLYQYYSFANNNKD